jgi:branched-chain amino acid transport system permease protein
MGIDNRRIFSLSWSLAAVTAAVAGVVIGAIGGISPQLGAVGLRIFPVVILGGLDSVGGALLGGVVMGVLENLAGGYLDPLLPGGGVKEVVPFVALVVILMIRPYGLFGRREIERL